jgi:hypothetical protein
MFTISYPPLHIYFIIIIYYIYYYIYATTLYIPMVILSILKTFSVYGLSQTNYMADFDIFYGMSHKLECDNKFPVIKNASVQ